MTKHNHQLIRFASYASLSVAVVIIVAKVIVWAYSGSLTLLSSLIDSLLDSAISLLNIFAVRYALKPADDDHRFGHGKAEDIAAFAQSAFIAGSGVFILFEAGNRLLHPKVITHPELGIGVMIFATMLTVLLLGFQSYVVKKTGSVIIEADAMHYKTDLFVNLLVIASFAAVYLAHWHMLDVLLALVIAVYIFYGAYKVGKRAFDHLMDRELSKEERQKIMAIALKHKDAKAVHDLRTRISGTQCFIQFHLELDPKMSLEKAHAVSDEVELLVKKTFHHAEVLIHQDPLGKEQVDAKDGRVLA